MIKKHSIAMKVIVVLYTLILLITTIPHGEVYAAVNEDVKAPKITAKSAVLYSVTTDEMLFSKDADKKMSPYSITKLMTCIIAVDNLDMDEEVKVTADAAELGESTMFLSEGEIVTVEQLLYGTLIMSGNDSAYMLAIATCGDEDDFVDMMNKKAEELGCKNTHFVNPHGLKDEDHYTTANDFLLIAREAFENETIRKIAGTKKFKMPATNISEAWTMETHTDLLAKKGSGVVAGKTGYWEDDDCTVALLYDKKGLSQILVLLGDKIKKRPKDAKALFEYGTQKIVTIEAINPGEVLKTTLVKHGVTNRVGGYADKQVLAYPVSGQESDVIRKVVFNDGLEAPISKGDEIGRCVVSVDGKVLTELPVLADQDIEVGWFPSYLYITNNQSILLGGVLALLIIILILRKIRMRTAKSKDTYEGKH